MQATAPLESMDDLNAIRAFAKAYAVAASEEGSLKEIRPKIEQEHETTGADFWALTNGSTRRFNWSEHGETEPRHGSDIALSSNLKPTPNREVFILTLIFMLKLKAWQHLGPS